MLNTEFGGMNEVLADLYADTGDQRWLTLSYKLRASRRSRSAEAPRGSLPGMHGNTQIPKLIGSLARFIATPATAATASRPAYFWDRVAQHHSFATGGHGKDEYFREPDKLGNIIDGRTAETCNVYNMLKMTRQLFALRPDAGIRRVPRARAVQSHPRVDGSRDGSTCYMVPVGRGVRREYQDMLRSFTCCVGTGMESHALHGYGLYYESGDRLWVNLYAPSTVEWRTAGATIEMQTGFPETRRCEGDDDVEVAEDPDDRAATPSVGGAGVLGRGQRSSGHAAAAARGLRRNRTDMEHG